MSVNQARKEIQSEQSQIDLEASLEARHRQRILQEDAERKAQAVVVDRYYEVITDHLHQKGGKIRLCKRMKNGNVHRQYVGRVKQCQDILAQAKKEGIRVI